jgi:hypothetical protein
MSLWAAARAAQDWFFMFNIRTSVLFCGVQNDAKWGMGIKD